MATARKLSNEEATPETKTEIPVFQEMINDMRELPGSIAENTNTSSRVEDLLIAQAIAQSFQAENDALFEETSSTGDVNKSAEGTPENLLGALNSTSKRLSLALNSAASQEPPESEENFSNTTPIDQTPVQQIDSTQPCPVPPSVQATIPTNQPKKKQHIMISYNRSCEDGCRKIRNSLKGLKYKVWMDVYDMRDNFIEGMAKAIRNSYIVLICINRKYDDSYWCKKEIQDIAIKRIKFIPCFMEEPFDLVDWLEFLVNGNVWIDFSKVGEYDNSFKQLIGEITTVEERLAIYPRETPPTTPTINTLTTITVNPTVEESFDMIMRNFKTWVEENRDNLKRCNRTQSSQLIDQLIQGLRNDNTTPDDQYKKELLQQLLSSTSQNQNQLISQLFSNLNESNYLLIKSLLFIMALWAVRVVFKKN